MLTKTRKQINEVLADIPRQHRMMYDIFQLSIQRRTCKNCNIEQESSEFAFDEKSADYTAKICNTCISRMEKPQSVRLNREGKQTSSTEPPASTLWEMAEAEKPEYRSHENRRIFNNAQKRLKWFEQDGKCEYCQADLSVTGFHADHIHPHAKGGLNSTYNLALACPKCNTNKNDKLVNSQWQPPNRRPHKRRNCNDPMTGFRWDCE